MFVSAVAPIGEKSPRDSDLDVRQSSEDKVRPSECGINRTGFLKTVKYPVILMNMGGIYVPSFCVCDKSEIFNDRGKSNSQDICDSDSNEENAKSFIYVQCVKGNCLSDDDDDDVIRKCPDDDSKLWGKVKKIACILMIVCHTTNSIRYIFILKCSSDDEGTLIFSLINYFILSSFFYLLATNSFSCLKHFTPFLSAMLNYERKYEFKCKFKKYTRHNFVLFCLVIIFQLAQASVLIYGILTFSAKMGPQLWPLTHLDGVLRFFAALIVGVGVFFAGCNQYGTHFFRAVVTNLLHCEFECLARDLSDVLSNSSEDSCSEILFDQSVEKFKNVCDLMDKGNNIIKHTVAAGFIFGLPTLCLVVYGVIKHNIQLDHYLVLSVNTVIVVVILVHTTWTLARLKSQIKAVCNTVYFADWSTFTPQLLQKMLLFSNMFCTNNFGFTVYGIFIIDWSALLMICGILATYCVLLAQSDQGKTVQSCQVGRNITL